ncbi:hypothetical protein VPH35_128505 [Triticum aestivum]
MGPGLQCTGTPSEWRPCGPTSAGSTRCSAESVSWPSNTTGTGTRKERTAQVAATEEPPLATRRARPTACRRRGMARGSQSQSQQQKNRRTSPSNLASRVGGAR